MRTNLYFNNTKQEKNLSMKKIKMQTQNITTRNNTMSVQSYENYD